MPEDLAQQLRSLIEKQIENQDPPRLEATAARAELSRAEGRLIPAVEFENAIETLKAEKSKEQALSDRRTKTGRWLSIYTPKDEKGLYPFVKDYLSQKWLVREEHGLTEVKAADIAETWNSGRDGRPVPDMLAWIVTGNEMSRRVDFVSFEVKPDGALPIEATTQANSQRNFVSFAYLVQQIGPDSSKIGGEAEYKTRCREYGLGLIVFNGELPEVDDFRVALLAERNLAPQEASAFFRARVSVDMAERAFLAVGDGG